MFLSIIFDILVVFCGLRSMTARYSGLYIVVFVEYVRQIFFVLSITFDNLMVYLSIMFDNIMVFLSITFGNMAVFCGLYLLRACSLVLHLMIIRNCT